MGTLGLWFERWSCDPVRTTDAATSRSCWLCGWNMLWSSSTYESAHDDWGARAGRRPAVVPSADARRSVRGAAGRLCVLVVRGVVGVRWERLRW